MLNRIYGHECHWCCIALDVNLCVDLFIGKSFSWRTHDVLSIGVSVLAIYDFKQKNVFFFILQIQFAVWLEESLGVRHHSVNSIHNDWLFRHNVFGFSFDFHWRMWIFGCFIVRYSMSFRWNQWRDYQIWRTIRFWKNNWIENEIKRRYQISFWITKVDVITNNNYGVKCIDFVWKFLFAV